MHKTVNERINFLLKESGLSKNAFAKKIGITGPAVDKLIATHGSNPQQRTIRDICATFGVNENWLTYGEGEIYVSGNISMSNNITGESELIRTLKDQIKFLQEDLNVWRETARNLSAHLGKPNPLELLADTGRVIRMSVSGVDAA